MTRTLSMAVLVGVLVLAPVGAQQPHPFMGYGYAGISCGSWLEYRKTPASPNALVAESWVYGFVSGAGWQSARPLRDTDTAGVTAFVDQYCDAHRIDTITQASMALVRELTVKTP